MECVSSGDLFRYSVTERASHSSSHVLFEASFIIQSSVNDSASNFTLNEVTYRRRRHRRNCNDLIITKKVFHQSFNFDKCVTRTNGFNLFVFTKWQTLIRLYAFSPFSLNVSAIELVNTKSIILTEEFTLIGMNGNIH